MLLLHKMQLKDNLYAVLKTFKSVTNAVLQVREKSKAHRVLKRALMVVMEGMVVIPVNPAKQVK